MTESPTTDLPPQVKQWVLKRLRCWYNRIVTASAALWLAGVISLLGAMRFLGEANVTAAFLLYLPPLLWFIPVIPMIPALCFVSFSRALVFTCACGLIVWLGFGYEMRANVDPSVARSSNSLVILTNNRGQNAGQSLQPFKNYVRPDIMVFQESSGRAAGYLADKAYAEFKYGQSVGEFTLLSRFPILTATKVSCQSNATKTLVGYAARFEIDWNGLKTAIYSVHLPSPRGPLMAMRSGAFLYGLPTPKGSRWQINGEKMQAFWQQHIELARDLITKTQAEQIPVILAGDFNAPHLGYIHDIVASVYTDTHEAAGSGFGFSFPGVSRNPLSLGGPWIRIDYIFCGQKWEVEWNITEPDRTSQHRAVAASLQLTR
jgi:vancomycin resistance protein VanJ